MISIVIPTYEMNGAGPLFINNSLEYLEKQVFTNFEIIVSDHSYNDDIKNICSKFYKLNIKYIKNEQNRGSSSANLNNAILNSKYNIIKFLMQDEYIFEENTLLDIKNYFDDKNVNWVATEFYNGSLDSKMTPYYNDEIIYGNNTIGSPSIISIRKTNDIELFNNDLIWLMDCEYYRRLYDKWGAPHIINNPRIFINHHANQVTNIISREEKDKEHMFLLQKYGKV